jgi:WhiB family transcriptional regulator, redox-sensing transcriptional regulator
MDEKWMNQAECIDADPETFFPETGVNIGAAKKICDRCPVSQQCLDYAIFYDLTDGVWGGMSGNQRLQIRWKRFRDSRKAAA